jgi:hypothetical protein
LISKPENKWFSIVLCGKTRNNMVFNRVMVKTEIKWYYSSGVIVQPDMKWFNDRVGAG